jgi:hypothetical protein
MSGTEQLEKRLHALEMPVRELESTAAIERLQNIRQQEVLGGNEPARAQLRWRLSQQTPESVGSSNGDQLE